MCCEQVLGPKHGPDKYIIAHFTLSIHAEPC